MWGIKVATDEDKVMTSSTDSKEAEFNVQDDKQYNADDEETNSHKNRGQVPVLIDTSDALMETKNVDLIKRYPPGVDGNLLLTDSSYKDVLTTSEAQQGLVQTQRSPTRVLHDLVSHSTSTS